MPLPAYFPFHRLGIQGIELDLVDGLTDQERGLARIDDLDLLQHLANDHFDMLVIDRTPWSR